MASTPEADDTGALVGFAERRREDAEVGGVHMVSGVVTASGAALSVRQHGTVMSVTVVVFSLLWSEFRVAALLAVPIGAFVYGVPLVGRVIAVRRAEQARIAERADSQNRAVLAGDDTWGIYGVPRRHSTQQSPRVYDGRLMVLVGWWTVGATFGIALLMWMATTLNATPVVVPPAVHTVTKPVRKPPAPTAPVPIPNLITVPPTPAVPNSPGGTS